ncbi:MAG: DEAD/DEAH box helicase [Desulfococcaceae bacterium]
MMQLKPYQHKVIAELAEFLDCVHKYRRTDKAFEAYWNSRNISVNPLEENSFPPYKNNIPGCVHICLKVPTAGGKTFIACNALKTIFDSFPVQKEKVVVWLVPSATILDQTVRNLKDPDHPYRQKINACFNNRVEVYEKTDLLFGGSFNPSSVREQLSILVLSFDTFRSRSKEDRKIYQDNSYLEPFVLTYQRREKLLPDIEENALIQVINQLNPVCIVDESHNATSELSIEMLKNINPAFILDLTATPRENSNIISYADSLELKKENMVKLPVIVYNQNDRSDVVSSALELRKNLEYKAVEQEKNGGEYIRPIVLFQAQPKTDKDSATFEKIKEKLIKIGIPKEEIAIKTANVNELKNENLLDRNCRIRYIITVNALKEGWDCPFAYILASLANKSSAIDVEQILGRILRQPYAARQKEVLLNLSYVLTASRQFLSTLENIVRALNKAGFSEKDFRVPEEQQKETQEEKEIPAEQSLFDSEEQSREEDFSDVDETKIGKDSGKKKSTAISEIEELAKTASEETDRKIQEYEKTGEISVPDELRSKMKTYAMKEEAKACADKIILPQFYIEGVSGDLFSNEQGYNRFDKNFLLGDFDLGKEDIKINFDTISAEIYKIDLSADEHVPEYELLKQKEKDYILDYVSALPEERQISYFADLMASQLGNMDMLSAKEIRQYITRVIDSLNPEQLSDLKHNYHKYAGAVKHKISTLILDYSEKQFYKMLDTDEILCRQSYRLPAQIAPKNTTIGIPKSLYVKENEMNNFEKKLINRVAGLGNIRYLHKNNEKNGFCINVFVNHNQDFNILSKSDKIVILETKGDDRDNSDSRRKLKLGLHWANRAGENFRYYMVFENNPLEEAKSLNDFLEIIKKI